MGAASCAPSSGTSSSSAIGLACLPNAISSARGLQGFFQDLEDFRDKYLYVLTTIPDADLPKPSTMFNHLIDELDKCPSRR